MIICFSGTGNSLAVAMEVKKHLVGHSLLRLDHINAAMMPARPIDDNEIIWVFPTYSWGMPPVIKQAIEVFKGNPDAVHHMITTCGDDVGNCASQWRKTIKRYGYKPFGAFSVQMPNTYVNMKGFDVDSTEIEKKKIDSMPGRVKQICDIIKSGKPHKINDVVKGSWPWVKTALIYPWFMRYEMNPANFKVDKSRCTSCGLCSERCPLDNIILSDTYPRWDNNCTMCLRCYHHCPTKAIGYLDKTKEKGQYTRYRNLVKD